jgi:hypothetical protein
MLLSIRQPRVLKVNKPVKEESIKVNKQDNFVITIDLQKPYKIAATIICCLDAAFLNGKKYQDI